jgi:uncharacterized protein
MNCPYLGFHTSIQQRPKMQEELEILFNRRVDLIGKKSIERSANWIRRQEILSIARIIYVQ